MPTLDEVFAAMDEVAPASSNAVFTIDPDTRQIDVPASEAVFGVESDTKAERKYFQCPRIVGGGVDLAACFVRVNYRNANGDIDAYLVEDLAVSGNMVTFSWELSRKVTKFKGEVQFVVCACYPNTTGTITNEWNTTLASGRVLEGLEADTSAVEIATADVIAQLLALVDSRCAMVQAEGTKQVQAVQNEGKAQVAAVENAAAAAQATAVAEIQAKGANTLATIPAAYTTLCSQVDKLTRNTAGAIVCQADGETITLQDSSDNYLPGLRLFGKTTQQKTTGAQLFDASRLPTKTAGGATVTNNGNGTFTVSGSGEITGSAFSVQYIGTELLNLLKVGTLYLEPNGATIPYFHVYGQDAATNRLFTVGNSAGGARSVEITQEILDNLDTVILTFYGTIGATIAPGTVQPMLYQDGTGEWEPYSGGVASPRPEWPQELQTITPAVTVGGANLCDLPDLASSEINGITFEYVNGTAKATGTATAMANVAPGKCPLYLPPGVYTVSGGNNGVYVIVHRQRGSIKDYFTSKNGLSAVFDVIAGDVLYLYTQVPNTTTVSNVTVYPMVNAGTEALPWERYKATQTLTTPNGLPGIPVTSGGNYTDAAGQQWICDEMDLGRGVYVQRLGHYIFDGSTDEAWMGIYTHDTKKYVYIKVPRGCIQYTTPLICNYSKMGAWSSENVCFINNFAEFVVGGVQLESALSSVAAFREHLAANPIELVYILETPVEVALDEVTLAAFRELHTNKPTTTLLNDSGAHMSAEYVADTKLYIDRKLEALVAASNT